MHTSQVILEASCSMVGTAVAALVTCLVCRRPGVLLFFGGLILILPVRWFVLPLLGGGWSNSGDPYVTPHLLTYFVALPLLVAGIILLVGGMVRWSLARRRGRPSPAGPVGDPEPGSSPDG